MTTRRTVAVPTVPPINMDQLLLSVDAAHRSAKTSVIHTPFSRFSPDELGGETGRAFRTALAASFAAHNGLENQEPGQTIGSIPIQTDVWYARHARPGSFTALSQIIERADTTRRR